MRITPNVRGPYDGEEGREIKGKPSYRHKHREVSITESRETSRSEETRGPDRKDTGTEASNISAKQLKDELLAWVKAHENDHPPSPSAMIELSNIRSKVTQYYYSGSPIHGEINSVLKALRSILGDPDHPDEISEYYRMRNPDDKAAWQNIINIVVTASDFIPSTQEAEKPYPVGDVNFNTDEMRKKFPEVAAQIEELKKLCEELKADFLAGKEPDNLLRRIFNIQKALKNSLGPVATYSPKLGWELEHAIHGCDVLKNIYLTAPVKLTKKDIGDLWVATYDILKNLDQSLP